MVHIPGVSSIGEHPLVRRLLKGVHNIRPPQPRYKFIWDTDVLIEYLRTLDNATLDFKLLSYKTVTLLTILSGQRVSTIHLLKVSDMFLSKDAVIFSVSGLLKHSKPGRTATPIEFPSFPDDLNLCPVGTLHTYLQRRATLVSPGHDAVFLTLNHPHHPASKDTLARLIKLTLDFLGIDNTRFKPHSCRSASSSKASAMGVSVDVILRSGQWMLCNGKNVKKSCV